MFTQRRSFVQSSVYPPCRIRKKW